MLCKSRLMCAAMPRHRHHLIVLMHGSHGHNRDLRYLKACIESKSRDTALAATSFISQKASSSSSSYKTEEVEILLAPPQLQTQTDRGLVHCYSVLADAIRDRLDRLEESATIVTGERRVVISGVGHSLGGVVLRGAMQQLAKQGRVVHPAVQDVEDGSKIRRPSVVGGMLCTVASPHLGVATMKSPLMRTAGRLVGNLFSQTYAELFLDQPTLWDLANDDHCGPWGPFERVLLLSEIRDKLVPLHSSSLLPVISPSGSNTVEAAGFFRRSQRRQVKHESCADVEGLVHRHRNAAADGLTGLWIPCSDGDGSAYAAKFRWQDPVDHTTEFETTAPSQSMSTSSCPTTATVEKLLHDALLMQHAMKCRLAPVQLETLVVDLAAKVANCKSISSSSQSGSSHKGKEPQQQRGTWSPLVETWKTNAATTTASHRAVVCKDPFHQPQHFGWVSEWIADQILTF